jgi:hypothetical protein
MQDIKYFTVKCHWLHGMVGKMILKMDFSEVICHDVYWLNLAQNGFHWHDLENFLLRKLISCYEGVC